jgi:hypothetical protein
LEEEKKIFEDKIEDNKKNYEIYVKGLEARISDLNNMLNDNKTKVDETVILVNDSLESQI